MCCTYSIICWLNTKRFLSIFSCFWKVFCFEKFQKIQNFLQLCFGNSLTGHAIHELTQKLSRLSSEWVSQSWKTFRKFFKIFGFFFSFSQLILAICLWVEAPIASLHRRLRDSLAGGPSSREKDLYKIFKILFKGFWRLAHESVDSQKSCVLHE